MKKRLFLAAQVSLLAAFIIAVTAIAAQPGSGDDPLVSKSYVDDKINQAIQKLNGSEDITSNIDEEKVIEAILEKVKPTISGEGSAGRYTPVFVSKGQILYGGEGTEIIMRSGIAFTHISEDGAGIVNATAGLELEDKYPVKTNNIHIIPRDDGRGIRVTEDAWFIVKGSYRIEEPKDE